MKYCIKCMSPIEDSLTECPYCGFNCNSEIPLHHLFPGTILNNKYLVGAVLGEGGFGITYIGIDTKLDMKVAIKEYYPNGYVNRVNTSSPTVYSSTSDERKDFFKNGRERFLREARILAKFSGYDGVVEVKDFFEENNTAYIVMEYLDGQTLKDYLKSRKTLTPEDTISLLMPVMETLKDIHTHELIHRDISPDNIMLVGGRVKLLDFGAARNVSASMDKSLSVMLKPGYAPEEQYRSRGNQGPWTDVYAICATMYKCITGITPDESSQRLFKDELKTPSELGINIDPAIEATLIKGLSVIQKDRFQSIDELIDGLKGIGFAQESDTEKTVAVATIGNHKGMENKAVADDVSGTIKVNDKIQAKDYEDDSTAVINNFATPPVILDAAQQAPEKKKSKKFLIWIFIILLFILLIALAFLFFGKDLMGSNGGKNENSSKNGNSHNEGSNSGVSSQIEVPSMPVVSVPVEDKITVPNVVGYSRESVENNLKNMGFIVTVNEVYDSQAENGKVISQSLNAYQTYDKGTAITITVSKGKQPVTVTFNADGGSVSQGSKTVYVTSSYETLPTPKRDYYTFNGWYTAKSGGTKITDATAVSNTSNHTLYARWTQNPVSGWVKASEMPSGAQEVNKEWRYTLREYNTSKTSSSLPGWTKYDTKTTWGNWSGWSTTNPTNGVRNVESRSVYDHTEYHYYRWIDSRGYVYSSKQGNGYWLEEKWFTYELPVYDGGSQGTAVRVESGGNFRNRWIQANYENNRSVSKEFTRTIERTEWRYQEPVYTYYYYRDVSKTATSNPTGQSNVSNVVKWVRYRAK